MTREYISMMLCSARFTNVGLLKMIYILGLMLVFKCETRNDSVTKVFVFLTLTVVSLVFAEEQNCEYKTRRFKQIVQTK